MRTLTLILMDTVNFRTFLPKDAAGLTLYIPVIAINYFCSIHLKSQYNVPILFISTGSLTCGMQVLMFSLTTSSIISETDSSLFQFGQAHCQILKSVTLSLVRSSEQSINLLKARSKPSNTCISDCSIEGFLE